MSSATGILSLQANWFKFVPSTLNNTDYLLIFLSTLPRSHIPTSTIVNYFHPNLNSFYLFHLCNITSFGLLWPPSTSCLRFRVSTWHSLSLHCTTHPHPTSCTPSLYPPALLMLLLISSLLFLPLIPRLLNLAVFSLPHSPGYYCLWTSIANAGLYKTALCALWIKSIQNQDLSSRPSMIARTQVFISTILLTRRTSLLVDYCSRRVALHSLIAWNMHTMFHKHKKFLAKYASACTQVTLP